MNTDKNLLCVPISLLILGSIFFVIERVIARGRNRAQPIIRKGWLTDAGKAIDASNSDEVPIGTASDFPNAEILKFLEERL